MGWYAAADSGVRSMGTMFFRIDTHGQHMLGRWVGQSHDGPVLTGWGTIAKTHTAAVDKLRAAVEGRVQP